MNDLELILHLRELGVKFWLEGDAVKFTAPQGVLTTELREQMKTRKDAIRELLQQAQARQEEIGAGSALPGIRQAERTGPLPLSHAQQRLWFLDQLHPGSVEYIMCDAVRMHGLLDVALFEAALHHVVARHETLRTTFPAENGQAVQVIAPTLELRIDVVRLEDLPADAREEAARRRCAENARTPFDLARGPLIRCMILELAPVDHVVCVALHHIISDGWSVSLLIDELNTSYNALCEDTEPLLAPLPVQYVDYAIWQRQILESGGLERALAYWRKQLAEPPGPLALPVDGLPDESVGAAGGRAVKVLDETLSRAFLAFGRERRVTMFMSMLAIFTALLHRYTGAGDVVVGSPMANRHRVETEKLIGLFLNTLVLRTRLSGSMRFSELLERTRDMVLEAEAHQDVPFEHLVAELQPERDLNRNPFFDVMLNVVNVPEARTPSPRGITSAPFPIGGVFAKVALTLYVREEAGRIEWTLLYRRRLFTESRAACILDQLEHLARQVVAAPDQAISVYSLVTPASRALLPDPAAPLAMPSYTPVPTTLRELAQQMPDQVAVRQGEHACSYGELYDAALALARALVACGVRAHDVVAVTGATSIGLIAAMSAVMTARAILVTIDPQLPLERQRLMLRSARARCLLRVVSSPAEHDDLDIAGLDIIEVRARDGAPGNGPLAADISQASLPQVHPEDAAYLFFTSGTTGVPKAVLGWHKGLGHFLAYQRERFQIGPRDRAAQLTGLSFDVLLRDVFTPLTGGATLVIPEPEDRLDPARLLGWMEREGITMLHTVPTLAQGWLAEMPSGVSLRALRWAFFAGEPLTDTLVRRWREAFPDAGVIVNLYGPTETTLAKCVFVVGEEPEPGVQPVGRAMPHAQALVLNEAGGLAGIGELGEIVIRTPFRSLGYFDNPEETARRFFVNPFRAQPDDRDLLYRTGDLGRYRPDGNLEIRGRVDHQVKIAGVRVEPEEVAAVLLHHRAIKSCVVVAKRHPRGNYALVAYVVPTAPDALNSREVLAYLGTRLPAALVPSLLVPLQRLPVTQNGKVDRHALPAPDWDAAAREAPLVRPRTELETRLAEIWSRLLGVADIGVHDSFFVLGGHSLLAMRLVAEIGKAFAVDVTVRTIFEAPTIAELAAAITRQGAARPADAGTSTRTWLTPNPADRLKPFPLTDIQAAFWVGRNRALAITHMATQGYLEFEIQDIDLDRLCAALHRVIQRHDMLRATIDANGQQTILAEVPAYAVKTLDLRGQPVDHVETELASIRAQMASQALPSDRWPLFAIRATRLDDRRTRLHVVLDALIMDVWSALVFGRELATLYAEPDQELPALDLSFRDYVLAEIAARESDEYRAAHAYWMSRVEDLPPAPELPLTADPGSLWPVRFRRRTAVLPRASWHSITERAAARGVSPSALILTVYAEILARWSRSARFTLNVTLFNRRPWHSQVNDVVGNFTALNLLAVDLREREPFMMQAHRLQEQLWSDISHSQFTGVQVMRELVRRGRTSIEAAMPVVFTSTLGMPIRRESLPAPVYSVTQSAQVHINHGVSERDGDLVLHWDTLDDVFRPGVLDEMFAAYVRRLEELAKRPEAWTETAWTLGAPEAAPGTVAAVAPELAPRPGDRLHLLFEDQARVRPHAIAVIAPDRTLSYGELHAYALHLGARLRDLGARPNQLVAVVMEKGWEQVAAALGILYAGAAYLPIDPALPEARILYLLQNGEVSCVLSQSRIDSRVPWPVELHRIVVDMEEIHRDELAPRPPLQALEDLAYVIYTSGSTGAPKGVMIDHRGAVNTILDMNRRFAVKPDDRVLGVSSLSFDLSVYDVFGTLAAGAALVLPEAAGNRDPEHWASCMARHGVTVWNSVPALMEMLVEWAAQCGNDSLRSLRLALLSGDWIPLSLPDRLRALVPDVAVISLGGATEASIWSILYPIGAVDPTWKSIPYGKAMDNQAMYVLDERLEPRPVWVAGEIYIGGIGVARGYWRDEDKTRARFLSHPKLGVIYRTGDFGRWMPDGNMEFLGRLDNQVKIRGHRIELGEIEAVLAHHPDVRESVATVHTEQGERALVAYVTPRDPAHPPDLHELREHMAGQLPGYMVPASLMVLESLPLTGNGKVDRARLPRPDNVQSQRSSEAVAPRTASEEVLCRIWQDVLHIPSVDVHDNFFELGGDSILAIQVLARAARQGLRFSARHIFEHPTVARLASVVELASGAAASAEPVTGTVPLTPVQRWFFAHGFTEPHHWNQAVLMELKRTVSPGVLRRALAALIEHHDALRMRFVKEQSAWTQVQAPWDGEVPFEAVDLSLLAPAEQAARMEEIAATQQASLSLSDGPVLRIALVERGAGQAALLLLVIHHLVVDGISWRLLLEDLEIALEQLHGSGEDASVVLGSKTASFQRWSTRLLEYAQEPALRDAAEYWLGLPWSRVRPLPVDHPGGDNTVASAQRIETILSREDTRALLRQVPRTHRVEINDILLTALTLAFGAWTGSRTLLVDLEGHGREHLFDGVDISRTVGWFTAISPVLLDLEGHEDMDAALDAVKAQLRRMPGRGVVYGLLRYLRDEPALAQRLAGLPQAEVSFDYLGQTDAIASGSDWFAWSGQPAGPTRSPRGHRRDLIEVIGFTVGEELHMTWTFSARMYEPATIQRLADRFQDNMRALIAHCLAASASKHVPADFALLALDQESLDRVLEGADDVEDLYHVSPFQQEMLTQGSTRPGAYHVQLSFDLHGALDLHAFTRAWQAVVDRHGILRTGFSWVSPDMPVQVVHRSARVDVEQQDWRDRSRSQQEAEMARVLDAERRRGFALARPPLMRVAVIRLSDTVHRVVWSHHHLLLDGWCEPLVLRDVLAAYVACHAGRPPELAPVASYRNYIAWLAPRPWLQHTAYWQEGLAARPESDPGLCSQGLEIEPHEPRDGDRYAEIPAEITSMLRAFARQHGLTLNTLVQGALALALRSTSATDEVVFGVTVSGRPPDLDGVESMVGLFVNSLPLRVRFPAQADAIEWLRQIQSEQAELHEHEHTPPMFIRQALGLPAGAPLFEVNLRFQNYPVDVSLREAELALADGGQDLRSRDIGFVDRWHYPVNIVVYPDQELRIHVDHDRTRVADARVAELIERLRRTLEEIPRWRSGERSF